MGLDYLHRICKIIHTDLKPENVNLCLTEKEVNEIAAKGQLTTTKMYHQPDDIKALSSAAALDPKSFRGRKEWQEDEKSKHEKQAKRNEKKKRQRQKKKEQLKQNKQTGAAQSTSIEGAGDHILQTEEDLPTGERDKEEGSSADIVH